MIQYREDVLFEEYIMKIRPGFSMIELVFVIVIIGILSAVAIPKFAATRDDAIIAKARSTVATIRTGLATLRQKNILKGVYTDLTVDDIKNEVLEYGLNECSSDTQKACWEVDSTNNKMTFRMPDGTKVEFKVENNKFVCTDPDSEGCKLLAQ